MAAWAAMAAAGENATGGNGGLAAGGGLYNTSLGSGSTLNVSGNTLSGNQANGGRGGDAGTGTTVNGGFGGNGGTGGNGEGGGLFEGTNTTLTVVNNTIGGLSADTTTSDGNILTGGVGGRGGNGGTAGGVLTGSNGGNGGNGGNTFGAGIYVTSGAATFVNNTIIENQTLVTLGSDAGGAAGRRGRHRRQPGSPGANGTANAGGFYSQSATTKVGNDIIDLNSAGSNITGTFVPSTLDIAGNFTSLGNNLIGNDTLTTFNALPSDSFNITQGQLNLGPLQNNGGVTSTDALLVGSVAIDAGNTSLVPNGVTTDQRGTGFVRVFGPQVDVGAFEFQEPEITNISPTSAVEGSGSFTLTIAGSDFSPGATTVSVSGAVSSDTFTSPTSITGTDSISVNIPVTLLYQDGPLSISVTVPDYSSGVSGSTVTSNIVIFPINPPPSLVFTYPNQSNLEGDTVSLASSNPDTNVQYLSATNLPPSLTLNSHGVISGTISPTGAGDYTVVVNAVDDGVAGSDTFNWAVGPLITSLNPSAEAEGSGSFTLTINGRGFRERLLDGVLERSNDGILHAHRP